MPPNELSELFSKASPGPGPASNGQLYQILGDIVSPFTGQWDNIAITRWSCNQINRADNLEKASHLQLQIKQQINKMSE